MRVVIVCLAALSWIGLGCGGPPGLAAQDAAVDVALDRPAASQPCTASGAVDLLVVSDNSGSMRDNQAQLAQQLGLLVARLSDPADDEGGRMRSLHVGLITPDLGTPGSTVPSCTNSDVGDDGLLNPVRQGLATRSHQPWTVAPPGVRPARCSNDPNQFPTFLTYAPGGDDAEALREAFVCITPFAGGGCGLEQQLESVYRAVVVHDAHDRTGNSDPNAGFLRDDAVLAVLVLSDEEDGSTRDCRYAERDASGHAMPCVDATAVFDSTSERWSTGDLNLRFYLYVPGSAQDPTWPLERYYDPSNRARGLLAAKAVHPDWIVFGALAGVPLTLPRVASGGIDWDTLLGRSPDGADGYVGISVEGPISMRQGNYDRACTTRVVPACRREGSAYDAAHPACDTHAQYFAWPGRRIAALVRRFDEGYGNGVLHSICASSYAPALTDFADHIRSRICR